MLGLGQHGGLAVGVIGALIKRQHHRLIISARVGWWEIDAVLERTMTLTRTQWRTYTDWPSVCRRAAGRRKYNEERQRYAGARADLVCKLLLEYGVDCWGVCARIARELSVSRATVCRDRQRLVRSLMG